MSKFEVGDLVKVNQDTVEDWDNMMELYGVDPDSLGVIVKAKTNDLGDHFYDILFQNTTRTLHFDHYELETV
jgi:hypothetical protein